MDSDSDGAVSLADLHTYMDLDEEERGQCAGCRGFWDRSAACTSVDKTRQCRQLAGPCMQIQMRKCAPE